MLVTRNMITAEQLEAAQRNAADRGERALTREIVNLGYLSPEALARAMSEHLGLPFVDLKEFPIDSQAPMLMPEEFLRRHSAIPIRIENGELFLAVFPPVDLAVLDEVELTTGYRAKPVIATENDIHLALNQHFSAQTRTRQTIVDMRLEDIEPEDSGELILDEIVDTVESPPIVRLVVDIIDGAINERASDIHLEPQEDDMRVRYRIDGVLHDIMRIPRNVEASVISRIKILANMDITERRAPQDGHMNIRKAGAEYDLRISTFLTVNGEKLVMRLLSKETMLLRMEELGLFPEELERLKRITASPYGIVLITGPTGCGKTTTLYSILNRINNTAENIVTIEDPVEYKLPGINQSQVNRNAGVTFATGLRSLLRQDPNVIMVGEIRDLETAEIAIQAALTGHLVFSTLHTADAPSAVTRLIDMGIKRYLISASIVGIVAQRLVRTICPACKEEYKTDVSELLQEFGIRSGKQGATRLYRGRGCKFCGQHGYRGRTGVYELLTVTDEFRDAVLRNRPAHELARIAVRDGMTPLRHAAFRKVLHGATTLEEVRRSVFISL